MFIAIKNKKIIVIDELEWQCRRRAKGLSNPEYWTWLATVTSEDENGHKTYDFSGEDYEIVETDAPLSYESTDEEGNDITISFNQSGHITSDLEGTHYHLTWNGSEIVKDDTAKAAHDLAEEWKQIRAERNRLLSESDWTQGADSPLTTQQKSDWAVYRTSLRTLPEDQSSVTSYSDINWPTKPS
tara:strand:- start:273 stop:827 length:555 start_codon:yes stop_codon:yes gene_type:complete